MKILSKKIKECSQTQISVSFKCSAYIAYLNTKDAFLAVKTPDVSKTWFFCFHNFSGVVDIADISDPH